MVCVKMYGPASEKVLRMDRLKDLSNLDLATDFLRSMPSFSVGFNFGTKLAAETALHAMSGIIDRDIIEQASSPVEPFFCLAC